jgi:hypothetical protein
MGFNPDSVAAPRARRAIADLKKLGVTVPGPVRQALDVLDTIAAAEPKAPPAHILVDAMIAGDPEQIDQAAIAAATFEVKRAAHGEAVARCARVVSDALRASRGPILRDLTKRARQHADKIAAANSITDSLDNLIRAGKITEAETVAAAEPNAKALAALQAWADRHLGEHLDVPAPAVGVGK